VQAQKGTGDLLAEVQIAVPTHVDGAAREALEKYREAEPKENPRAELLARAAS
jgi:molecular chaperone DnaJ